MSTLGNCLSRVWPTAIDHYLLFQAERLTLKTDLPATSSSTASIELRELTGFYQLLLENYSMSTGAISYNAQGLLEDVIIFWQRLNDDVSY